MINVLVTGGNGQLASSIKEHTRTIKEHNFIYVDKDDLDITDLNAVSNFFNAYSISFCVNCAAYTNVDKAEIEQDLAAQVNSDGPQNLAEICNLKGAKLIHISTDFVFDGTSSKPYSEDDKPKPINVYGATKLKGEQAICTILKKHFIIRTSWLYSEYGTNFLKTMLQLGSERKVLNVVFDQIGSPTYAKDLAKIIVQIITNNSNAYGLYHYSNEGAASWYEFAKAIFENSPLKVTLNPIKSIAYSTTAKRPTYCVLNTTKIKNTFGILIPYWKDRVVTTLNILREA